MAYCELLKGCLFFNDKMPDDRGLGYIYKQKYCRGDSSKCARHTVATTVGRDKVPANLYPNMIQQATEIVLANS